MSVLSWVVKVIPASMAAWLERRYVPTAAKLFGHAARRAAFRVSTWSRNGDRGVIEPAPVTSVSTGRTSITMNRFRYGLLKSMIAWMDATIWAAVNEFTPLRPDQIDRGWYCP